MSRHQDSLVFKRAESSHHGDPWPDNYADWLLSSMEEIERLAGELENLVNSAQDEQPPQAFFERNPGLLVQLLRGSHGRWVFPKPRLGSEHVPDFAICEEDSGGYHWHLVELENPNFDVLTSKGQPTAKLAHAIQQVNDWRIWLRSNCQYAQNELGYQDLDAEFRAIIVIGRREDRTPRDQKRYRELSQDARTEVMSYDRLFERVISLARGQRQSWEDWLASGEEPSP